MSELDINNKSKCFGEKCVIKMTHILDILHRVILVERHNAEVVHCRVHRASEETASPQRHHFNNILASILLSLVNRHMGKEQIDTVPLIKC